jgi:hypothetical protein
VLFENLNSKEQIVFEDGEIRRRSDRNDRHITLVAKDALVNALVYTKAWKNHLTDDPDDFVCALRRRLENDASYLLKFP